jgi:spore coat protein CotH
MNIKLISILLLFACIKILPAQNPGDRVFSDPHIFEVRFHFPQTDFLDSLHKSHDTGEYIPGDIEIDGVLYDDVGVRFKGHSSYLFYPGEKKPFRIKFNKFKDHLFDGMKKISLNNGWGDPTMIREKIHLDFLKEQGIPAPRANFAQVYIDSVYWGFYSLVEHVDKVFLKSWFSDNDGNLYKAEKSTLEWQGQNQENYYEDLQLKTNEKENNWSDLIHFLDILNNTPDSEFERRLEMVFNPDPYITSWAVNNLFVNLDSYLGSATNYYLYNNPISSQFEWIAWDVNLSFAARSGISDLDLLYAIPQRPLMMRLLAREKYKNRYLDIINSFVENYFNSETLFPKIDQLAQFIKEDYLADTNKMYSNEEIITAIDQDIKNAPGLKSFILERRRNVLLQLDSLNVTTSISDQKKIIKPSLLQIYPNYPNPFNAITIINYELRMTNYVNMSIYNLIGQKITTLISEKQQAGIHQVLWNAENLPSGMYYAVIKSGDFQIAQKLVLSK